MRVLAAPDKFRGTATAFEVTEAVRRAVESSGGSCVELPLADGGEGMLKVYGGPNRQARVTGPLGKPVQAGWRLEPGGRAYVESALASGLLLAGGPDRNDPVAATTRGTGELIATALDEGATRVLVGLGGSATTDGGMGALEALAGRARWNTAEPGSPEVFVCCDVHTTYTDAARVFGPQKGAPPDQVTFLERRLVDQRRELLRRFGVDVGEIVGSGAAGGLAGGLAAMGAKLVPGFEFIAADRALDGHLREVDLVVTGEGRLDRTSWQGKVVGGVVAAARAAGVPVLVVAGAVSDGAVDKAAAGADRTGELDRGRDQAADPNQAADRHHAAGQTARGGETAPGFRPLTVISLTEMFGKAASFRNTANCIRRAVERYLVVPTIL